MHESVLIQSGVTIFHHANKVYQVYKKKLLICIFDQSQSLLGVQKKLRVCNFFFRTPGRLCLHGEISPILPILYCRSYLPTYVVFFSHAMNNFECYQQVLPRMFYPNSLGLFSLLFLSLSLRNPNQNKCFALCCGRFIQLFGVTVFTSLWIHFFEIGRSTNT